MCLSKGTAVDKVSATLAVLGVSSGADMGMSINIWLDAFQEVARHLIEDFKSAIASLCGGGDERNHAEIQAQCDAIIDSVASPHVVVRYCDSYAQHVLCVESSTFLSVCVERA